MALLLVGDPAPNFALPCGTDDSLALYGRRTSGRLLCLVFCNTNESSRELIRALRDAAQRFSDAEIGIVLISHETPEANAAFAEAQGIEFFFLSDVEGSAANAYGLPGGTTAVFLISRNLRILDSFYPSQKGDIVGRIIDGFRAKVPRVEPIEVVEQAPVLLIPDVLDEEMCQRLIHVWRSQGNAPSGFMRKIGDVSRLIDDRTIKNRRDHFIRDPSLRGELQNLISRRVLPEIQKVLNFEVTRLEDFRIGRYDAETGGYFRIHRDNTSPGTAHRRWAMTLNLNTEDYEGGHLRFPEYGPHLYRPATGGAVVFSCMLLHEALDVRNGHRFVLLCFMYAESGAKIRAKYLKRVRATS